MNSAENREALIVVDLGFGDAGKGTVTDFLVRQRRAHTVVRFNGSAQAGHNVVTAEGQHHTFAQFGSGSFVHGLRTHLSRFVLLHPTALLVEARYLADKGVADALDRITVSESSLVITPFQQAANRLRELARGDGRHGSCGVGVGETMADALDWGDDALRAGDLADRRLLYRKLFEIQLRKREGLSEELRALEAHSGAEPERRILEDRSVIDEWVEAIAPLLSRPLIVPDDHLGELLREPGSVVFEGAQGVLLDEWRGFHPYTTWSTCTFDNALELLAEHRFDGSVSRLGLTRTYGVRHGPGPFPTEAPELTGVLPEPHNDIGPWQGVFRRGWLDAVLLRYALEVCGGADGLVVTHLDALDRLERWQVCDAYQTPPDIDDRLVERDAGDRWLVTALRPGPFRDLEYQEALGRALERLVPRIEAPDPGREPQTAVLGWLEAALGVPVWITSRGASAEDKLVRDHRKSTSV